MTLVWNVVGMPMAIKNRNKIYCSIRNGFLESLPPELKSYVDKMPLFQAVQAFCDILKAWGIKTIYAGNAAAHFLGDSKTASKQVDKFIKEAEKLKVVDPREIFGEGKRDMYAFVKLLADSFKNTGVSIFFANDSPAIYFLTDADNYYLFRCLGKSANIDQIQRVLLNCMVSKLIKDVAYIGARRAAFLPETHSTAIEHLRICKFKCEEKYMKEKGYRLAPRSGRYIEEKVKKAKKQ